MNAVRRLLATAGVAALVLVPAGSAWADDPTPSADPSASAVASPAPSPTAAPTDSPEPSAEPTAGGCDANPEICQSGEAPTTTTECDPFAASPPPGGEICIAGGLNPGNPNEVLETTSGSGAGTLPRTGPAPLVPTFVLGSWLLLIGVVAARTGRRRTARI